MLKPIIFWGATGHAKVLRDLVEPLGYKVAATFDNNPATVPPFADVPLFIGESGFNEWRRSFGSQPVFGLAAIGGSRGHDRRERQKFLETHQIVIPTVIHNSAIVANPVELGVGSQILAGAIVCVEARAGEACIINTGASVDHECVLGHGVHIAPGAVLAGCVRVGDDTLIGAGAVVVPRISIGRNVIIGAGAVVTRDVPDNKVAYGNPARIRHDIPRE